MDNRNRELTLEMLREKPIEFNSECIDDKDWKWLFFTEEVLGIRGSDHRMCFLVKDLGYGNYMSVPMGMPFDVEPVDGYYSGERIFMKEMPDSILEEKSNNASDHKTVEMETLLDLNVRKNNLKKIVVHEIHKGDIEIEDFNPGTIYATIKLNGTNFEAIIDTLEENRILDDCSEVVTFTLLLPEAVRMEDFIKHISCDFSNAFIIVSPTDEQDIIVDFTLEADKYFRVVDYKPAKIDVTLQPMHGNNGDFQCGNTYYINEDIEKICGYLRMLASLKGGPADLKDYRGLATSLITMVHWLSEEDLYKVENIVAALKVKPHDGETSMEKLNISSMQNKIFKDIIKLVVSIVDHNFDINTWHSNIRIKKNLLATCHIIAATNKPPYRLPFEGKQTKELKKYLKEHLTY